MIELLRQHGVTPVLVFDGAPPAMKARLNEERRAQRAAHRAKADALLAQGKRAEVSYRARAMPQMGPDDHTRLVGAAPTPTPSPSPPTSPSPSPSPSPPPPSPSPPPSPYS